MKVGFHYDSFSLRGVDQATFEYAQICEEILGDEVLILKANKEESKWISDNTEEKVRSRFSVYDYDGTELGLQRSVRTLRLDSVYTLNTGYLDKRFRDLESLVWNHSVFPGSDIDCRPHTFAVISEWLSKEFFAERSRVVPHVIPNINVNCDLRNELGIPKDSLVLGSMGGRWNFNSKTALIAIERSLERRSDLWFLTLNQSVCAAHERIIELPGTGIDSTKHAFVSTCDYMLHGRSEGETFGIACGEFCNAGKPVLAWKHSPQRAHLDQFVLNGYCYTSARDLEDMICGLERHADGCVESKALAEIYSMERVAHAFDSVFRKGEGRIAGNQALPLDSIKTMARYGRRRMRVELMRRDQLSREDFQLYCGKSVLSE